MNKAKLAETAGRRVFGGMVFGKVPQDIIDHHYRAIIDTLKTGDAPKVSFLLACINALKDKPGYGHIRFAAQNAIMHGWLSVDAKNRFVPKETL